MRAAASKSRPPSRSPISHVIARLERRSGAARPSGAPRRWRSHPARPEPTRAAGSAVRAATARARCCTALELGFRARQLVRSTSSPRAISVVSILAARPWPCRPPWRWRCARRAVDPPPPPGLALLLQRLERADIEHEAAPREIARHGVRIGAQQLRVDHCASAFRRRLAPAAGRAPRRSSISSPRGTGR